MICTAFTDGAARGNPGDAGVGILVKDPDGTVLLEEYGFIGTATNNVAEYTALLLLLDRARSLPCSRLIVHSDSELMVRQIAGTYRVRDAGLKVYHGRAMELIRTHPCPVDVRHIARSGNAEADRLANRGIDTRRQLRLP